MKNQTLILSLLVVAVLALATFACGSPTALPEFAVTPEIDVEPTEAPEATDIPAPTATAEPTDIPQPTDTPEPTEIPEELQRRISQIYGMIVLIQADAVLLNEAAERTASGDLDGAEQAGTLLGLAAFVQSVDEALAEIDPLDPFADAWEDAVAVHEQTKDIFGRWFGEEILSPQVVEEMEPVLEAAEQAAFETERVMASEYGANADELAERRQVAIDDMVAEIFESETPVVATGDLEVRGGRMYVAYDYLHVVGEVVNDTDQAYEYVKVVATFYNADGEMLGTDYSYIALDVLPPHDVGVFDLSGDLGEATADVVTYTLQVEGDVTSDVSYDDLVIAAGREYDQYGYHYLVGQVENAGDSNCEYVRIVVAFYDADGMVVGVDYTYTDLDIVLAGDKAPFKLSVEELPEFERYELWVEGSPTDEEPYDDFEISVSREYEQYGYYYLVGQVQNVGDSDCEYVEVVAAFYDADGQVLATDYTYTELDVVPAGESSPFELSVEELPEFDRYNLWIEGTPTDS